MKCQKNKSCVKQPTNALPDFRKRCSGCDKKGKDKSSELLLCPFCNSDKVSLSYSIQNNEGQTKHYFIECEVCSACGPNTLRKDTAIALWNFRTTLQFDRRDK